MRLAQWLRRPVVWAPISLALLAFVAWRSRIWEAGERLGLVDPAPLLVALGLSGAILALWAVRSAGLLRAAGHPVPVAPLVPMTGFANTINNLTPGSTGEIFRLWLLRAHHGVPYATGGAVILVERVTAFGYLTGSAILFWLAYVGGLPPLAVAIGLAILVVLPGAVYALGLRPSRIVAALPLGRPIGPRRWEAFAGWLRRVDETIARLLTHPFRLAGFAVATAAILACYAVQLMLVGRALGVTIGPLVAWGALGLGLTAGVLSLLPFGLGSTDVVVVALLGAAGVPAVEAAAMTFGYRIVSTLPLALAGVASYAVLSARLPAGAGLTIAAARQAIGSGDSDDEPE